MSVLHFFHSCFHIAYKLLVLYQTASYVMRHLETKREAAERRRVSLMSKGIAKFLETSSLVTEHGVEDLEISSVITESKSAENSHPLPLEGRHKQSHHDDVTEKPSPDTEKTPSDILDKIKMTLDHAANILRESLELTAGGVAFLDTALGQRAASTTNSYFDLHLDESGEAEMTPSSISRNHFWGTMSLSSNVTRYAFPGWYLSGAAPRIQ